MSFGLKTVTNVILIINYQRIHFHGNLYALINTINKCIVVIKLLPFPSNYAKSDCYDQILN